MKQRIISIDNGYNSIDAWIEEKGCKRVFLVCGASIKYQTKFLSWMEHIAEKGVSIIRFSDFQPNPLYENVLDGLVLFREMQCDAIIAVGGGSAMDVAKAIKAYVKMKGSGDGGSFLKQEIIPNNIPLLAIPTTAGTGSEVTRYAVFYYGGNKQSVTSESIVPDAVVLDPDTLTNLPVYQKKAAMADALCHAIESYWSINSNDESKYYSKSAISEIMENMDAYLANDREGRVNMLHASNVAGKAINITQTTAGHAMCYKLTGLFGVAHGHAAFLCDKVIFRWMINNMDKCVDHRGKEYVEKTLNEIGQALGCENADEGARKLERTFRELGLDVPKASAEQYEILRESVNIDRLKNHPFLLDTETIDKLYHEVLR